MSVKERVLQLIDERIMIDGEIMPPESLRELQQLRDDVIVFLSEANVTTTLYGAYCPTEDKTFVMRDTYVNGDIKYSECVGWYCGEPDDKFNEDYSHGGKDLLASYDTI